MKTSLPVPFEVGMIPQTSSNFNKEGEVVQPPESNMLSMGRAMSDTLLPITGWLDMDIYRLIRW
jgi:hypothetical protein